MAEFHVVIEGLELDGDTTRAINDDIQKVVLSRLAEQDLTTVGEHRGVVAFRPNRRWNGLVARVIAEGELRNIPSVASVLKRFE